MAHDRSAEAQPLEHLSRTRWESPQIGVAITQGIERSQTFRDLAGTIDASDGLVYVLEGKCGEGVRACLHLSVELSNGNRLLRIFVDLRRAQGCELVGSIGHELRHAIEALSEPNIVTSAALSSLFRRIGHPAPANPHRFETNEAEQIGMVVAREVCEPSGQPPAMIRVPGGGDARVIYDELAITAHDAATRHVRGSDPKMRSLIEAGLRRSATFRRLVQTLNESDVFVYVDPKQTREALGGYLAHNVTARGGYRYLHIFIDMHGPDRRLLPLLAHELQHAVEVSQDPDARDENSVEGLFNRLAVTFGCGATSCSETEAAREIEAMVVEELRAH